MSSDVLLKGSYTISLDGSFKFSEVYDGLESNLSIESEKLDIFSEGIPIYEETPIEEVPENIDKISEDERQKDRDYFGKLELGELTDAQKILYNDEKDYDGMIKHVRDGKAITKDILKTVLSTGLDKEEAERLSSYILNFFGYSDRIIDNVLGNGEKDERHLDRNLFYMLQDVSGIVDTDYAGEVIELYDGREWRIHYWWFRRDNIIRILEKAKKLHMAQEISVPRDEGFIYHDIWGKKEANT